MKRRPREPHHVLDYPTNSNPFADPLHGKPGRPPKDHLTKDEDEKINQRYARKAFIVPADLVDRVSNDAGDWGFKITKICELRNGGLLMIFEKVKGPLAMGTL
jgi:hypothetical protein